MSSRFDIAGARKAGATDQQIAEYLAPKHGFRLDEARKAGASDTQIADFLAGRDVPDAAAPAAEKPKSLRERMGWVTPEDDLPAAGNFEENTPDPRDSLSIGMQNSVMRDQLGTEKLPRKGTTPVRADVRDAIAALPQGQQEKLAQRGDWRGQVARSTLPETQRLPDTARKAPKSFSLSAQQEANRGRLLENETQVLSGLERLYNLDPEDAKTEFGKMLKHGIWRQELIERAAEATWGEAASVGAENIAPTFEKAIGGIGQMMADVSGDPVMAIQAQQLVDASGKRIRENFGRIGVMPEDGFKSPLASAIPTMTAQLPFIIAGAALRSPAIMNASLGVMGAEKFGESYAGGKEAGLNLSNNMQQAIFKTIAEVGPEKLSLSALERLIGKVADKAQLGEIFKALIASQATEHLTEQMTTVADFMVDRAYTDPNLTFSDLAKQVVETFKGALIQAPLLSGAGMVSSAAGAAVRGQPQYEEPAPYVRPDSEQAKYQDAVNRAFPRRPVEQAPTPEGAQVPAITPQEAENVQGLQGQGQDPDQEVTITHQPPVEAELPSPQPADAGGAVPIIDDPAAIDAAYRQALRDGDAVTAMQYRERLRELRQQAAPASVTPAPENETQADLSPAGETQAAPAADDLGTMFDSILDEEIANAETAKAVPQQEGQQEAPAVEPPTDPLQAQYEAAKAAGDDAEMRRIAGEIKKAKRAAEKKPRKRAEKAPAVFSLGEKESDAEPITVRDGVVYIGDSPAIDFETEHEVRVPDGASQDAIVHALDGAGAIVGKLKVFGHQKPKPRKKSEYSLLHFLKARGGLASNEALDLGGERANIFNRRLPGLFRNDGLGIDAAREVMEQHGWLDGVSEEEQLTRARELISEALRGGDDVIRDSEALALLEAESEARAVEALNDIDEEGDAERLAVIAERAERALDDVSQDDLDDLIGAAFDSEGLSNEEIPAWLSGESGDAESGLGADEATASDAVGRGDASGGETDQGQDGEFGLDGQTADEVSRQEAERKEAEASQEEITKQQIDTERDAVPFSLSQQSQPRPQGSQTSLFTPDNRPTVDALAGAKPQEEQATGATDEEVSAIADLFADAQFGALHDDVMPDEDADIDDDEEGPRIPTGESGWESHRLFEPPEKSEVVRLQDRVKVFVKDHGWMTPAQAKAVIAQWKERAAKQGESRKNDGKVVLSLFDRTGSWSQPWEDAGYMVVRFDIQNDPDAGDVNAFSTEFFNDWWGDFDGNDIYAILAACPCTDFANSGARHFAAKDADGRTRSSVELVRQTLATIEHFKPAVWAIENPVGRIENLTGLPPWRLSFNPNHLGDPYTKKTLLWGRFNGDLPIAPVEPTEGSKMHSQYGGKSLATKNARSVTPEGFAYGFFMANNAIDNPVLALANKFDRLDRGLIEKALKVGVTEEQITNAVEDLYYMDLDDEGANAAIRELIAEADDGSIDAAAHDAATSPRNEDKEPSQKEKEAGNYKKGHWDWEAAGLNISVENPEGSERSGVDPNGKPWSITMKSNYGYIKRTEGNDGEHVDVFVKPGTPKDYSGPVFVIDQKKGNGHFDEHKVMVGWSSKDGAIKGYKENYARGWDGIKAISKASLDTFKQWIDAEEGTTEFSKSIAFLAGELREKVDNRNVTVRKLGEIADASQALRDAVTAFVEKTINDRVVVFQKGALWYAIHPATDGKHAFQVTRYNDTGALGDTRYDSVAAAVKDGDFHNGRLLSEKEAEETMTRLAAAEMEYQKKRAGAEKKEDLGAMFDELLDEETKKPTIVKELKKAKAAKEPKKGDRFRDGQGKEWEVWSSRHGSVEAFPVVDGKAKVSRDTGEMFAIDAGAQERHPDRRSDFFPIQKAKKPVTPQLMVGDPESYIKVAADSIESLRKEDVFRVLVESNRREFRLDIARYIKEKRPDLASEVDSVLEEAAAEDAQSTAVMPDAQDKAEQLRKKLVALENEIVGIAGLAPDFIEDALRSRKVPTALKTQRKMLLADLRDATAGQRTAGEAAKSAAKNAAAGIGDTIDALGKLFGDPGKLSSGLTLSPETYAKAKPLFASAVSHFAAAGKDAKEAMRAVIKMVLDKFGADTAKNMKPYIVRFIEEWKEESALPAGWSESTPGGMIANADPVEGGIIDSEIVSGKWFVIPNNDAVKKITGLDSRADALAALKEALNYTENEGGRENVADQRGRADLEQNRRDSGAQDGLGAEGLRDGAGRNDRTGESGVPSDQEAGGAQGSSGVSGRETASDGESSDQSIYGGAPTVSGSAAGNNVDSGSPDDLFDGLPDDETRASAVEKVAARGLDLVAKKKAQDAAEKIAVADGIENIRATLPYLLADQQDDVAKAETRFAKPDGYGMLFTNGTGTGKTFTGLGVVKRFARRGKTNILIVAPSDKIMSDWQSSGLAMGLNITALESVQDAGKGIVITTYANLGQNNAIASRDWDLVVTDESHYLSSEKSGTVTSFLEAARAITLHPDGVYRRAKMLHADEYAELEALNAEAKRLRTSDDERSWVAAGPVEEKIKALRAEINKKVEAIKKDVAERQGEKRPRLLALSATPFAYEKSIEWANGYLFDFEEGARDTGGGYNAPNAREQFFIQHFGYRMRYGKLTEPDAKVDRGLMQRQFNTWLKKQGTLSGRILNVDADYDRRFVMVDSAIGKRIDEALLWLNKREPVNKNAFNPYRAMARRVYDKFDHLSRRYLLEAIKAREVIPHIKAHMALGRKVVVFHDFKKGGGFNPFRFEAQELFGEKTSDPEGIENNRLYNAAIEEFNAEFADLIDHELFRGASPIDGFLKEFPGVLLFNGDVSKKKRRENANKFNDDASGPQIILVQSAAGKEGVSLHDTTGKHQRVLFNLGLPTAPTTAIQQEGRIYRVGQVTDALFRYLNTGTNWERWAFATTIATRASTAENLATGELARALKDAFINAFEESDAYPAGMENEGKGGKERDRLANEAISEYDRAKTFYFGQQKKTSRTKAQEGEDYFATPEPVGFKMVEWADLRPGEDFLEPSGGHGAIARWAREDANRTAIEPSHYLGSRMAMVFGGKIIGEQFEEHNPVNKYDAIVMNPPFGVGGKTAIEHLDKAARQHLRDNGRIVALIPTGPAADKRFEKWFYEETEREATPIYRHPEHGPIYENDTLVMGGFGKEFKITGPLSIDKNGGAHFARPKGSPKESGINLAALTKIIPGKRTEMFRAGEGLHLAADIRLPMVTFERAGTKVATRIVIIDKTSADNAPNPVNLDFSNAADIKELFDRLEPVTIDARNVAEPAEQEASKPAAKAAPATGDDPAGEYSETKHTKTGEAIFLVKPIKRVDRAGYDAWSAQAKKHRGFYSRFNRAFNFKTKEDAQAFLTWMNGGSVEESAGEYATKTGDEFIAGFFKSLTDIPGLFQNEKAAGATPAEALAKINPEIRVQPLPASHHFARPKAENYVIFTPDGGKAYLHDFGKEVQFNASDLKAGKSRGSAVYQAIFDWANSAGKIFEGDSQGLSLHGALRRTESMISSALKHGSTLHMKPHAGQLNPSHAFNETTGRELRKVGFNGFAWATGSDDSNIAAMLKASYDVVKTLAPGIENVSIDQYGDFVTREGEFFTDEDFRALADEASAKLEKLAPSASAGKASPIGSATLKRAAIYRTVSSGAGSAAGRALVADIGAKLRSGSGSRLAGAFYSPRGRYGDTSQNLALFGDPYESLETRPETNDVQLDTGREALESLERRILGAWGRRLLRRDGGSILGIALSKDFRASGATRFTGKRIGSPADLAHLAQVVRDPRFETFRMFFVNDAGEIVGVSAITSRLPAAVHLPSLTTDIEAGMKQFGASGYWLLHNHPGGKSDPSDADAALTVNAASRVPGFKGHVVIDFNEYSTIDGTGLSSKVLAPELAGANFFGNPSLPNNFLGAPLNSTAKAGELGKRMQARDGFVTVVMTENTTVEAKTIVEVPAAAFNASGRTEKNNWLALFRRLQRESGAGGHTFAIVPNRLFSALGADVIHSGIFTDVVDSNGTSAVERGLIAAPRRFSFATKGEKAGIRVEEGTKTDTPEFKRWFGDSKVVDARGAPLVVYHGAPDARFMEDDAVFKNINERHGLAGGESAFWFAASRKVANTYADDRRAFDYQNSVPGVVAAYLRLQNPLIVDGRGRHWREAQARGKTSDVIDEARAGGHDGVIIKNVIDNYQNDRGAKPTDTYVVFSSNQIKSATDNNGNYDPSNPSIVEARTPRYTPVQESARRKAGLLPQKRTIGDRVRDALAELPGVQSLIQGAVDKFKGIERAEKRNLGALPTEQSAYVAARLSTGVSSIMRAMLLHGTPQWMNDVRLEKIPDSKGLLEILDPVKEEIDDWLGWMVGKRASRLLSEGKERNFTSDEIDALIQLGAGREQRFGQVAREFADFKRAILDIGEKAGLINAETRPAWDQADWIPFYRVMENEEALGPNRKGGFSGQSSGIRKLKGGANAINDPLANIIQNFQHLIDASLKNNVLRLAIEHAEDAVSKAPHQITTAIVPLDQVTKILEQNGVDPFLVAAMPPEALRGLQKMWAIEAPSGKDVVRLMVDGRPVYYRVHDPLLLRSLTSFAMIQFPGLNALRWFKRTLTALVTATPDFWAANYTRDVVSAMISTRHSFHFGDSVRGIGKSFGESGGFEDMMFAGASFAGGYVDAGDPAEVARNIRRTLRKKGYSAASVDSFMSSLIDSPAKLWEAYSKIGMAVENANREAIYEATMEETGSRTKAAYEAKDILDFSLRGSNAVVQVMADVVPFLNARAQGIYRLGRSNPKRAAIGGLMLMTLSLLLLAANDDDARYKALPDWEKDTYWHIFLDAWPGGHIRIPKPFELGAIFGSIPERIMSASTGDITWKKAFKRIAWNIYEQIKIDPIPQAIKPALEVSMNRSFFTGAAIENTHDRSVMPGLRSNSRTSETMKAIGETANISPKKLEHLWNGYFGGLGTYALTLSDMIARRARGAPDQAAARLDSIPMVKRFVRIDPAFSTQFKSDLYDMYAEVLQIEASIEELAKAGKRTEARQLQEENREKLKHSQGIKMGAELMRAAQKKIEAIQKNPNLTADQKREQIDALNTRINRRTQQIAERAAPVFN